MVKVKRRDQSTPFKAGQLSECRSFIPGFRGAWFRCKIKMISRGSNLLLAMEYIDFPGEKIEWTPLYWNPRKRAKKMEIGRELLVRPQYPRICTECESHDLETISEAIVVTDRIWRVGDLVDWWEDDCFWSASVVEIIGEDKVKIELPKPPRGEGLSYSVPCKDLRPSLDWSLEHGWMLPPSWDHEGRACARLIKPVGHGNSMLPPSTSKLPPKKNLLRQKTAVTKDGMQYAPATNINMNKSNAGNRKKRRSDSVSSRYIRDRSAKAARRTSEKQNRESGFSKGKCLDESIPLNSMSSDTVESLVLDLEELVSRIKWLKSFLRYEFPSRDSAGPTWKFSEHVTVFTTK